MEQTLTTAQQIRVVALTQANIHAKKNGIPKCVLIEAIAFERYLVSGIITEFADKEGTNGN